MVAYYIHFLMIILAMKLRLILHILPWTWLRRELHQVLYLSSSALFMWVTDRILHQCILTYLIAFWSWPWDLWLLDLSKLAIQTLFFNCVEELCCNIIY